jgi:hypothetical protein
MHGSGVQGAVEVGASAASFCVNSRGERRPGSHGHAHVRGGPRPEAGPTTLLETGLLPRLVSMATYPLQFRMPYLVSSS